MGAPSLWLPDCKLPDCKRHRTTTVRYFIFQQLGFCLAFKIKALILNPVLFLLRRAQARRLISSMLSSVVTHQMETQ